MVRCWYLLWHVLCSTLVSLPYFLALSIDILVLPWVIGSLGQRQAFLFSFCIMSSTDTFGI